MNCLDETTVALFLERRLTGPEVEDVERHIDTCAACRELVGELGRATALADGSPGPASASGALEVGDRVGRYVVLDLLGSGAMGAVYAAFDPDLDRKVAVKLLRRGGAASAEERVRLMREAQALARISDPGVVAVHDVGTHADQIFLAMEFVAGGTLKAWLRERPRTWREVVAIAVQAGRGLAAAHACGLIHRDIKPDNILVDAAGRARVGDFGLALAVAAGRRSDPVIDVGRAGAAITDSLTAPGTVVGTPAYMAPEQLSGQAVTARTDQFSFCATLYEALYGVRPYPGTSLAAIAAAMRSGRIADPPVDRDVPGWLRAAIVRGLAVDPAARHPSMDHLLAALAREPWHRRRVVALGAVALAVVAAAAAGVVWVGRTGAAVCSGGEAELAGVWDAGRREAVRRAFGATRLAYAIAEGDRVVELLDHRATDWIDAHRRACEDTRVRRTHDEAALGLRMECLAARKRQLAALVDVLAAADAGVVERAIPAVGALDPLRSCDDVAALRQVVPLPVDPDRRARVAAIGGELDAIEAAFAGGKANAALLERARGLVERAAATEHPPIHARALLWVAILIDAVGEDDAAAEAPLRAAIDAADRGRDDRLRFLAWNQLLATVSEFHPDVAAALVPQAAAVLARIGPDPELELRWLNTQGSMLMDQGQLAGATAKYLEVAARRERLEGPDSPHLADPLLNAAVAMTDYAPPADALATVRRAIAIYARTFGARHPRTASAQEQEALILLQQGEYAAAAASLEATSDVIVDAFGPDHPKVASHLVLLGGVYRLLERYAEAKVQLDRALAIRTRVLGARDPQLAEIIQQLALVADESGDPARALELHRQALDLLAGAQGNVEGVVALGHTGLGQALQHLGKLREALAEYEQANRIEEALVGHDSPQLAETLTMIGAIRVELGRVADGIEPLERALHLREDGGADPADLAEIRITLAQARAKAGQRAAARDLAEQARADYDRLGNAAGAERARTLRDSLGP